MKFKDRYNDRYDRQYALTMRGRSQTPVITMGKVLLFIGAALILAVLAAVANAQVPTPAVPACFFTPEAIVKDDPAKQFVKVMTRTYGPPMAVDAVSYLSSFRNDPSLAAKYERAAVAAQYTIAVNGETLRGMRLAAFSDEVPASLTVGDAIRIYIWGGLQSQRWNAGYYLYLAVSNNPCYLEATWDK